MHFPPPIQSAEVCAAFADGVNCGIERMKCNLQTSCRPLERLLHIMGNYDVHAFGIGAAKGG